MLKHYCIVAFAMLLPVLVPLAKAQQTQTVKIIKVPDHKQVDVYIGGQLFTSFLYPDSLEKPVLYPLNAANGLAVTRGFPLNAKPGDPTDHPHHIGLWFNYENLNGLDFWNNSYAIPASRKPLYGWIRTHKIVQATSGKIGTLAYHASWTNQQKAVILQETTRFTFSGNTNQRIIDRTTTLTAVTDALFTDVKDGLLGLRIAHALQMPDSTAKKIPDTIARGNYLSSTGKTGNKVWGTRASWCKVYGKIGTDSVSVAIIDHPQNVNYPTFWHARGYGLFAANPLGEKVFTNGTSAKNLHLKKGGSITFKYRVLITNGKQTPNIMQLNNMARQFATIKK